MIVVVDLPGTECVTALNVPGMNQEIEKNNINAEKSCMVELSMFTKCLFGNSRALAECKLLKNIFSNMYFRN